MASLTNRKRLLSCIVSSCDEAEYYTKVSLVDPKVSTCAGEIHRFELVDDLTPSKHSHWGQMTQIINVKWFPSKLAAKKRSKFLVRSGAGWRDGDEYFRCLAKEQRPWRQESTEKYWAKKRRAQWMETTKIEFLSLPAEIRNRIYSMVLPGSDVRPFKYTSIPPHRTRWTFFARPLRRSACELMRANRQIYRELTYQLYRFGAFWFSDLESLRRFFTRTPAAHLALVRTVKLRLDTDDVFAAFRANFSAEYLEFNRQDGLEEVVGGWNLEHLIIEFPCGFQLLAPGSASFGICNLTWCKWIVKAVMEYCSVHAVAKRVDFVGGPGFLPEEKQALAGVKLMYKGMSYAGMNTSNTVSHSFPWVPRCNCAVPCMNREFMDLHQGNVYNDPKKAWMVEDLKG